jgi:precorrin-2/cobalt-factor-2 C20-methyltransferase
MKLSMAHEAVSKAFHEAKNLQFHYFENIGTANQKYEILKEMPESFPYFSLMIVAPQPPKGELF